MVFIVRVFFGKLDAKVRKELLYNNNIELFARFCFPFGRPEGALKSTLSLLERVSQIFIPKKSKIEELGKKSFRMMERLLYSRFS